jgi:DNA polymerase-3 subunit epsilon
LLDSEILADVYLMMTGGQTDLMWAAQATSATGDAVAPASRTVSLEGYELPVVMATDAEVAAHKTKLQTVAKASGDNCLWLSSMD